MSFASITMSNSVYNFFRNYILHNETMFKRLLTNDLIRSRRGSLKTTLCSIIRSSHFQMFFKIGVLKNFTMFTKKTPVFESSLIKKRLKHRSFTVNNYKIFRNIFFWGPPVTAAVSSRRNIPPVHASKNF